MQEAGGKCNNRKGLGDRECPNRLGGSYTAGTAIINRISGRMLRPYKIGMLHLPQALLIFCSQSLTLTNS
ncbi:hypothetical protein [Kamptonema sp. UHCC 0994]|uniref:hypothetical protein n=1 Tax=Kamptonema sp. UHCC 0994 TaxID=3031329 RepID=UPI0023B88A2B|nr:hypothetical protein [Kamptonema sp. UHCC 0994]MDF0553690.1 hypothetical protein [Kamptonema sp. UHCC 0994]